MLAAERILRDVFQRIVEKGHLGVRFASGAMCAFGDGNVGFPRVAIRFADERAQWLMILDPALRMGELYMEGRLQVEEGDILDLIALLKRNGLRKGATPPAMLSQAARVLASYGRTRLSLGRSRRNVAHHYDLDERLFRLFLDPDLQYSCAYFEYEGQSLEAAQLAKKRHIASKLLPARGQRVLDIGCGWGGMALYLARVAGLQVDGVTLSEEQLRVGRGRVEKAGLSEQVRLSLRDYRQVEGVYDRIVSVGMFEHVGRSDFDTFLPTAARLLHKRGIFVLHSIGRTRPLRAPSPFIDKYIFPDSYIPALSEVLPAVERAGLLIKDVEVLPLHYAETLRLWRARFLAHRDEVLALYDERFLRMWEFYLAASEAAFRHDRLFVFQLQLCKHQDAVPTRRGYLAQRAQGLRQAEAEHPAYAALHSLSTQRLGVACAADGEAREAQLGEAL